MFAGQEISVSLVNVIDENLTQLKMLNNILFSVHFDEKYYADVVASGELTKLAYHSDTCVGAISCHRERKEDGAVRLYIMTLGVLEPYRRLGVGTRLMNHMLDLSSKENMSEVYLHVHTDNEDAINFYKKLGFETTERISNYYRNAIVIKDYYVLTKRLAVLTKHEAVNTDKK
ncbi:uncharacterized protein LOC129299812 [Prosopis cineraria]|uniref:uncharacterized protein LOC129299812 n=1 Tax=Prosopis cineraria TaxID=364024 RepID=UPI002410A029|nr:uncharacterized protein LOC129299812 [Prosopis cineraria]XP_054794274.1 uncharacterized protein LOC129299812 [Prosopis cineraria]XP_054794281.1 uncharacterized protein LOC129299812 [Prosopis cineraria]XP_054794288.1 uncharacterized protein LOC129299812 [Prosopis cineraria]